MDLSRKKSWWIAYASGSFGHTILGVIGVSKANRYLTLVYLLVGAVYTLYNYCEYFAYLTNRFTSDLVGLHFGFPALSLRILLSIYDVVCLVAVVVIMKEIWHHPVAKVDGDSEAAPAEGNVEHFVA